MGEQQLTWGGPVPVPSLGTVLLLIWDGSDAFHCSLFLGHRHSNLWTQSHPRGWGLPCHGPRIKNIFPPSFPPYLICLCFFILEPSNIQQSHLSTHLRWLPSYLESLYSVPLQQGRVDLVPSWTLRYGQGVSGTFLDKA